MLLQLKDKIASGLRGYCRCKMIELRATDPDFPIRFDTEMNEYHVEHGPLRNGKRTGRAIIRYCFVCGGKMPPSKRGTFFTKPDPKEVNAFLALAEKIKSAEPARHVEVMRQVLGEPDHTFSKPDDDYSLQQARIHNFVPWEKQYSYYAHWKTLAANFFEHKGGRLTYTYGGKQRKRRETPGI